MTRLYREGKAALKTELNKQVLLTGFNLLLIILLTLPCGIFPQIPINGFCKYNSFVTEPGFTWLFTANFNADSYNDLILYNPDRKEILSIAGNQSGNFSTHKKYSLPVEISKIHNITDRNSRITGYAFSSRKSRRAGIFEFQKDGRIRILKDVKLKSYPDNISTADINGDGTAEILVAGSAFDGLSILSLKNNRLTEDKIVNGASYSNVLFIDLSNDGFADIAAVNLNNSSIDFLYNNSNGKFKKIRSINITDNVTSLKSFDMNLDYYEDLVYSEGSSIEILYGDGASSYETKTSVKTQFVPDKIITADFNKDGKIDIAYMNSREGIISVIFAKDEYSFYPEIIYLKKEGIKNILPYYSKFINGIVAVSELGMIYTITNLASISDKINISIGAEPAALGCFDNNNNGITDICFIDNFDYRIKLIIRNSEGIPTLFYSYLLYESHSEILVDNELPGTKTFYCYTPGTRLIEALTIDFRLNKFSRQSIYSPGAIKDLVISHSNNNTKIYSAYVKEEQLGLSVFSYHDFRYTSADYFGIAKNVSSVNISLKNSPSLYYWQVNQKQVTLSKYSLEDKSLKQIVKASLPTENIYSVTSIVEDLFNSDSDVSFSFFKTANNIFTIISNETVTRILRADNISGMEMNQQGYNNIRIPGKQDLFFGETRYNGLKKLLFFNPQKDEINRVDFINSGRNFIAAEVTNVESLSHYFVKNMSYKKYHLVYTNSSEKCITIKEI